MMENKAEQSDEVDGLIAHLDILLKQRREVALLQEAEARNLEKLFAIERQRRINMRMLYLRKHYE